MLEKTRVFTCIVVVTNVLGNLLLSMGMRQLGSILNKPVTAYITALFNPLVAAGVALLIVWLISQMTLLSWADLSYVMPVTSIGYVLSAVTGHFVLHEQVSLRRWGGVWLIVLGVILVSRTPPSAKRKDLSSEDEPKLVCS